VEKQIIVINNSRETVTAECEWTFGLPKAVKGTRKITVGTGQQERLALRLELPAALPPGRCELSANVRFSTGEVQQDRFFIDVLRRPLPPPSPEPDGRASLSPASRDGRVPSASSGSPGRTRPTGFMGRVQVRKEQDKSTEQRVALFDPKGETAALLKSLGVQCQVVDASADLSAYDLLIVGKSALTLREAAPDISRVREGLKVVVFEQTSEALEKRLGFRVEEYGLRQVFPRVPDHPLLAGLNVERLHDWRGEATLLSSQLKYEMRPRYGPTVRWCDIPVTRVWRCGNRGNVASVLIEKPARGDFLPILDGGYNLQYSPLLEYREGRRMVLFCQLDVTGRTESEPAAEMLVQNLLRYVMAWKPPARRNAIYAGEAAGKLHLEAAGFSVASFDNESLSSDQVLVVGPGGGGDLSGRSAGLGKWLNSGGHMLAIGLGQEEAAALLPSKVRLKNAEHIAAYFEPPGWGSPLVGVGPADVHNRDPRELPLVSSGAKIIGNGVLAEAEGANVVFCQMAPWQFEDAQQSNLKRTHRRASFLVARLLANLGVASSTPLLERFHRPLDAAQPEKRWLDGLYLDQPEEWDDPYRFFRW